jgi:nitroreductase
MTKEAITTYPVHALIQNRWSARAFAEKPITTEEIHTILEAASWAPSAMNEQPWHYSYAQKGTPGFEAMWECLLPGNQPWTKHAATLVLCISNRTFETTGQPNHYHLHDAGLANANLLFQATSMGIYGHIMGGFDRDKVKETFGLTENEEAVCVIALGYLGSSEQLPEPFKSRELGQRTRKPLLQVAREVSFEGAL